MWLIKLQSPPTSSSTLPLICSIQLIEFDFIFLIALYFTSLTNWRSRKDQICKSMLWNHQLLVSPLGRLDSLLALVHEKICCCCLWFCQKISPVFLCFHGARSIFLPRLAPRFFIPEFLIRFSILLPNFLFSNFFIHLLNSNCRAVKKIAWWLTHSPFNTLISESLSFPNFDSISVTSIASSLPCSIK